MNSSQNKTLASVGVGEACRVIGFCRAGELHRRFLDVGIAAGAKIRCIGKSPMGDPRAYLIRGKVIAIRRRDAEDIMVD